MAVTRLLWDFRGEKSIGKNSRIRIIPERIGPRILTVTLPTPTRVMAKSSTMLSILRPGGFLARPAATIWGRDNDTTTANVTFFGRPIQKTLSRFIPINGITNRVALAESPPARNSSARSILDNTQRQLRLAFSPPTRLA